jgi:thiamine pyrophosphokinase
LKAAAKSADWIIAVDGGLDLLRRARVQPHLFVGDCDSLSKRVRFSSSGPSGGRSGLPAVLLPADKNASDLAVALEVIAGWGLDPSQLRVSAWGVLGGRQDHHWAAIQDLANFAGQARFAKVEAHHWGSGGMGQCVFFVPPQKPFKMALAQRVLKHTSISLFAVGAPALGVRTQGLQYRLLNETLIPGSRGLSNRPVASRISVSLRSGLLLVFVQGLKRFTRE